MVKVGPWQLTSDGTGAMRCYVGADVEDIYSRVAFIEKTPRIRIRDQYLDLNGYLDHLNWASPGWKGDGPEDPTSKAWCDEALKLFGYEFE